MQSTFFYTKTSLSNKVSTVRLSVSLGCAVLLLFNNFEATSLHFLSFNMKPTYQILTVCVFGAEYYLELKWMTN